MEEQKEKKKVLYIVESFASGVFNFLVDLINGIDKEFEITIAYGKRKETLENFQNYFSNRVKFINIKNFTRNINPKKDIKALKEIRKVIKEEKPDIVHLHSSKAGILGRLAVNGNKIKMFYNPHGFSFLKQDDSTLKRKIYWMIEKMAAIYNKNCVIIGCSNGEYLEAKKLNKNAICINNGINIDKLEKETLNFKKKDLDYKNIKICTVGRIGYQKNPQMFNKIAKRFPDIQFTWIGEGELSDELTSTNIIITGWKTREEVLKILNEQDIFILTSLWEGLPLSLLEAMYLKKICIVSDVIGNRDVIKDGMNGFIAKNLNVYIEKINKIRQATDKENYIIKERSKEDVCNIYNLNKMIGQYTKKYLVQ